jgi:hypothetical protein
MSSILTDETRLALAEYRRKQVEGTLSLEDMRHFVQLMRQGRVSAAAQSAASRSKRAAKPEVDSDAMLDELLS